MDEKKLQKLSGLVMAVSLGVMAGIAVYLLVGSTPLQQEALQEYIQGENTEGGYAYLAYEDKIFVPYCPYEQKYLGERIGYYDVPADAYTEASRVYVYEVKGYSTDQWIVELQEENCSEGMILREINATEIPDGLTSEYSWN